MSHVTSRLPSAPARVLFSLLGRPQPTTAPTATTVTSRYRLARYDFGDGDDTPRALFVVALLEHLRRARRLPARAVLLGTSQSIWAALVDLLPLSDAVLALFDALTALETRAAPPSDDALRPSLDALRPSLDTLQGLLSARLGVSIRCELIPTLALPPDQHALLARLNTHLSTDDRVLIDVTHGFGHQRILLAQTLVALEALRGVRIEALDSGALELTPPGPEGHTPVVRLDGVLRSVRLDRAISYAQRTGDPSGLVDALDDDHPLRGPLGRLADAWRLEQPDTIRRRAVEVVGTLGNLPSAARDELAALRAHLDEVIERHRGTIAVQQFAAARAATRRGDLLRAALALREACVTVACVARGLSPDDPRDRDGPEVRDWMSAQWVEFTFGGVTDAAWPVTQSLRNALAHAGAPGARVVQRAFDGGPDVVAALLTALVDALEPALRRACPGAFEAS